jgi:flagellar biosynthesis GTPase FlhF
MDQIQVKITSEIFPLEKKLIEVQVKKIFYLDALFQQNIFKKRDNDTLSEMIFERTTEFISRTESPELEDIFTRHNDGISFEDANEEASKKASETLKESFSSIFGMKFDEDADLSDPEKFQEYIDQQVAAEEAEYEARKANKKKTAKQIEKEEKQQQEAKNLNKTSRQIYMELVKAFHPDREKDELEKERKTLLMHRITEANEKDDLFELLRLRLELLGTDFEHSNDESLKYYVKLLKQQVAELEQEIAGLTSFGQSSFFGPSLYERFGSDKYQSLENKFKKEIANLKKIIKDEEKQAPFYKDSIQVKYLIDQYKKEQKSRNRKGFDINDVIGRM